jgi:hypothetical protein
MQVLAEKKLEKKNQRVTKGLFFEIFLKNQRFSPYIKKIY